MALCFVERAGKVVCIFVNIGIEFVPCASKGVVLYGRLFVGFGL